MSRLEFKPEMFNDVVSLKDITRKAQSIYDDWADSRTVVFSKDSDESSIIELTFVKFKSSRLKARIFDVQELECQHTKVIGKRDDFGNLLKNEFECDFCQKELKPKNGWEEI